MGPTAPDVVVTPGSQVVLGAPYPYQSSYHYLPPQPVTILPPRTHYVPVSIPFPQHYPGSYGIPQIHQGLQSGPMYYPPPFVQYASSDSSDDEAPRRSSMGLPWS
jgi:hypothetical protein